MGFLDDKENINGAECERKQGNDEVVIATTEEASTCTEGSNKAFL